jgi:hypothetical protein
VAYLVPIIIVLLGFAVDVAVETASEVSSSNFIDNDAGVPIRPTTVTQTGGIIDLRPESSL